MITNQRGQSLLEYVILISLVSLVSVMAAQKLGTKISRKMTEVAEKVDTGWTIRLSPSSVRGR